jgi:4-hydroxy-tetrahydrodipicolinate reductase
MQTSKIRVCLAGVSGWAGSALAHGIAASEDMELVCGVSRTHAGKSLAELVEGVSPASPVVESVEEAMGFRPDVFVEYTRPEFALRHIVLALEEGAHVVIGTSGLTDEDFSVIAEMADEKGSGVLACGNFSITAELLQQFAQTAARWIPSWEIIDYAGAGKADVPSGTARELASRLSHVARPLQEIPPGETLGPVASRGANVSGTQVHAVRLPGYVLSVETIFGNPGEQLTIRHDAGESAQPYVFGALLAIRGVSELSGLHRGLDKVMKDP